MITYQRVRPFGYEVSAVEDPSQSVLVQTDWDYLGIAQSFGWSLCSVQVQNRGYGLRPCDHYGTDGSIECIDCGLQPVTFIEAAASWLDENEGTTAVDPGYFS
jgi:hypothetical protein